MTVIRYIEEDRWTKYWVIDTTRIISGEGGKCDILHKPCPKCGNLIVLSFYDQGVYISAKDGNMGVQLKVDPATVIFCELCVSYSHQ